MHRQWRQHFLLLALFACSHAERNERSIRRPVSPEHAAVTELPPDERGLPAAVPADPRFFKSTAAPDPLSCRADKDCITDTLVDTQRGCCVIKGDPLPQTWSWHAWATEHRLSSECHEVKCEPVAVPDGLPRACLLEARCLAGRCQSSCSGESPAPTPAPAN
jgi:hypothetical protein